MRRALVALMTVSAPLTVTVTGVALFESCQPHRSSPDGEASLASRPMPAFPRRPAGLFADATPRYAGYLVLPGGQQKLAAVLDFAALERDAGASAWRKLRAVLRVMPGGFDGREYSAAYFPAVVFDPTARTLDFGAAEGGARVEVESVDADALTARVTAHSGAPAAMLQLARLDEGAPWPAAAAIASQTPLMAPVTGGYTGTCSGRPSDLQLSATKWRGGGLAAFGTLAGFELTATSGRADDSVCRDGGACVKETYTAGQLDLLSGHLVLRNGRSDAECRVAAGTLTCGPCTWARKAGDEAFAIQAPVEAAASPLALLPSAVQRDEDAPTPPSAAEADGQYYGYVVHDRTRALQLVALTLRSRPEAGDGIASLYFGEGDSSELIAYRLRPVGPVSADRSLVLDGDGDAFALIDAPASPVLTGTWFSKSFGRVGRFTLQRDLVPERPAGAAMVGALSGAYQSPSWTFEIAAASGVGNDGGEIFPLKLYGWAQENLATARRRTIKEGLYDHLTGTLALRLDDGRIAFGPLNPDGTLDLVWPAKPRASDALVPDRAQRFQRVKLSGERQARLGIP
jgi:hypothetical protein